MEIVIDQVYRHLATDKKSVVTVVQLRSFDDVAMSKVRTVPGNILIMVITRCLKTREGHHQMLYIGENSIKTNLGIILYILTTYIILKVITLWNIDS